MLFRSFVYDNTTATGTPIISFDPNSYAPATSQTSWTSATGEVWTVNQDSSTTGYKGVLCFRSMLQGDGSSAYLETTNNISFESSYELFSVFKGFNLSTGRNAFGSSNISGNSGVNLIFQTEVAGTAYWQFSNGGTYRYGKFTYDDRTLAVLNIRYQDGDTSMTASKNNVDISNLSNSGTATNSTPSQKFAIFKMGDYGVGLYNGILNEIGRAHV